MEYKGCNERRLYYVRVVTLLVYGGAKPLALLCQAVGTTLPTAWQSILAVIYREY